jgi:hypothetical protein
MRQVFYSLGAETLEKTASLEYKEGPTELWDVVATSGSGKS